MGAFILSNACNVLEISCGKQLDTNLPLEDKKQVTKRTKETNQRILKHREMCQCKNPEKFSPVNEFNANTSNTALLLFKLMPAYLVILCHMHFSIYQKDNFL